MSKTVLITGGNSGIGYATAKLFKKNNYDVTISGRNEQKTALAATELSVKYIIADLSNSSELSNISGNYSNRGLDVLINNAGIAAPLPIEHYTLENFNNHINTNLRAPIFLSQSLIPALEIKQGCIINISSVITKKGAAGFGIYTATKGALEAFTRSMAIELADKNIRINAICPGAIDTPMFDKFGMNEEQANDARNRTLATIPMRRFGKPEELAHAVLCQAESTYVTGAIWNVDGGVDT